MTVFKLNIQASDDGIPVKTTAVNAIIQVTRNQFQPRFENSAALGLGYTTQETEGVASSLFSISCTDADKRVSFFSW